MNYSHSWISAERGGLCRLFLFLLTVLAIGAGILFSRGPLASSFHKQARELVSPPQQLIYFTFGHRDLMADMLWVRSLQDFDYCESKIAESECKGNSWLFQMLDTITELSPYFRMAYSAGGMALTVIISDYSGASKLFDKAVAHFPDDWVLLYKSAYHATYEENDLSKAAALLRRAAQNGAPDWVYALSGRLYSKAGQTEMAESVAQYLEQTGGDPRVIARIRERIKEEDKLQKPAPVGQPVLIAPPQTAPSRQ